MIYSEVGQSKLARFNIFFLNLNEGWGPAVCVLYVAMQPV